MSDTSPSDRLAFLDKSINYGISPDSLPLGLSHTAFQLKTLDEEEYSLELVAGFIGVRQDLEQGTLQPEIGWAVRERDERFAELLDKIQQQHLTQPPINWPEFFSWDDVPKEHIQLLDRFDGATLYPNSGHAWQFVQYDSRKFYDLPEPLDYHRSATPLIDLEDGRCIAYVYNFRSGQCWILLGKPAPYADPYFPEELRLRLEDAVMIAKDIPQLLERIFQSEGHYYFDAPTFVADENLNNLESESPSL